MNKRVTVQALVDSVQQGDFETAKSMLAHDFQFSVPVHEPIDGQGSLARNEFQLKNRLPDLNYHFKVTGREGM